MSFSCVILVILEMEGCGDFELNSGLVSDSSEENCDNSKSACSEASCEEPGSGFCNESLSVIDFNPLNRLVTFDFGQICSSGCEGKRMR